MIKSSFLFISELILLAVIRVFILIVALMIKPIIINSESNIIKISIVKPN